jgi:hypothetical protein
MKLPSAQLPPNVRHSRPLRKTWGYWLLPVRQPSEVSEDFELCISMCYLSLMKNVYCIWKYSIIKHHYLLRSLCYLWEKCYGGKEIYYEFTSLSISLSVNKININILFRDLKKLKQKISELLLILYEFIQQMTEWGGGRCDTIRPQIHLHQD